VPSSRCNARARPTDAHRAADGRNVRTRSSAASQSRATDASTADEGPPWHAARWGPRGRQTVCVDKVEHQVWEDERVVAPAVHERPVAQDARSSLRRHPAAHTSVSHTPRLQELLACATVNARLRVVTATVGTKRRGATGCLLMRSSRSPKLMAWSVSERSIPACTRDSKSINTYLPQPCAPPAESVAMRNVRLAALRCAALAVGPDSRGRKAGG
jgi:hypothetical protein